MSSKVNNTSLLSVTESNVNIPANKKYLRSKNINKNHLILLDEWESCMHHVRNPDFIVQFVYVQIKLYFYQTLNMISCMSDLVRMIGVLHVLNYCVKANASISFDLIIKILELVTLASITSTHKKVPLTARLLFFLG